MTGTTSTSLWTVYNNGVRNYCGNDLAEGDEFFLLPSYTVIQVLKCIFL